MRLVRAALDGLARLAMSSSVLAIDACTQVAH